MGSSLAAEAARVASLAAPGDGANQSPIPDGTPMTPADGDSQAPFPERLLHGYRNFRRARLPTEQHRFRALAEAGQQPEIMVIGCSDSRVSPEVIFDAGPGELFVVRNVANLVPPYSPDGATRAVSAALEFAVQSLRVKHIIVLGHARCGGIRAYVDPGEPLSAGDFIGRWMDLIEPVARALGPAPRDADMADYLARLEQASAFRTLENLMTFPWIRERVAAAGLALHAAYFDVATGELRLGHRASRTFAPLVADQ
jgi:carbonic anhydrase